MQGMADKLREQRRLIILQALAEDSTRSLNDETLGVVLRTMLLGSTRDQLHADLHWLGEHRLVDIERMRGFGGVDLWGVTLRQSGLEIAQGHATHPGIARPGLR